MGGESQDARPGSPAPLPPQDAVLGPISPALDGERVADLLTAALTDPVEGGARVSRCRPIYLRYSPGRYCRVLYDVAFEDPETGAATESLAHATLLRDDRAARLWARGEAQLLAERARGLHRAPPAVRAAFLPELRALVQVYPVDLHLPGLIEAASPAAMLERLTAVLPDGERLRAVEPELVRYKPRRRAVLRMGLEGGERSAAFAKVRADGRGALIQRAARALVGAGVSVPEDLGYLDDLRLMLAAEAPGTRLKELRGGGEYTAAMEPVAEVLALVHACEIDGLPAPGPEAEVAELQAGAATAAAVLPSAAARIEPLADRLAAALADLDVAVGTIHGSFHDDQVLVSPAGVTLVDLDSIQRGPPPADVGHFLSYLSADGAEDARDAFLDAYARRGRVPPAVLVFEAASLLRWSTLPFRELRPDWPEAVERRVELAEARIHSNSAASP
jgi:hypothetical protein